jgi:hypothetical protein
MPSLHPPHAGREQQPEPSLEFIDRHPNLLHAAAPGCNCNLRKGAQCMAQPGS